MEIKFTGKRALVTGASRGIGYEILLGLAKCGAASVIGLARNIEPIEKLQQCHPEWNITAVSCDLHDWEATRKCIEGLGDIDLLVNNAGVCSCSKFLDIKPETIDDVFNINLKSVINISQVVISGMTSRKKGGAIVNVSSVSSQGGSQMIAVYSASKAALNSITRTMATSFGSQGIRVNAVCPTIVPTDMGHLVAPTEEILERCRSMNVLHKLASTDDVVSSVLFLLSDHAAMTTGAALPVEGGHWAK